MKKLEKVNLTISYIFLLLPLISLVISSTEVGEDIFSSEYNYGSYFGLMAIAGAILLFNAKKTEK